MHIKRRKFQNTQRICESSHMRIVRKVRAAKDLNLINVY